MEHKIIVIGGANADIGGLPAAELVLRDSNPGSISISQGGVGGNICRALRALGDSVSFITAFGDDLIAGFLREGCERDGIDISLSKHCPGRSSSVYMYIADGSGNMHVAVNDMEIVNEITPSFLASRIEDINSFEACVLDANLTREAIEYLAENVSVPLYADPVSTIKGVKLKGLLDRFTAIKPNELEAEVLGDIPCRCYTSAGADGIYASDGEEKVHVPAPKTETKNTNGCGDAAMAAIVHAELEGMNLQQTAGFAVKTATKKATLNLD